MVTFKSSNAKEARLNGIVGQAVNRKSRKEDAILLAFNYLYK